MKALVAGDALEGTMQGKEIALWICQIVAGLILLAVGGVKFLGRPADVFIFSELGMEPFGRHLIGVLEMMAGGMLLTRSFAALGGLLGKLLERR